MAEFVRAEHLVDRARDRGVDGALACVVRADGQQAHDALGVARGLDLVPAALHALEVEARDARGGLPGAGVEGAFDSGLGVFDPGAEDDRQREVLVDGQPRDPDRVALAAGPGHGVRADLEGELQGTQDVDLVAVQHLEHPVE